MTFDSTDPVMIEKRDALLFHMMEATKFDMTLQLAGAAMIASGSRIDLLTSFEPTERHLVSAHRDMILARVEREARGVISALAAYRSALMLPDREAAALTRQHRAERKTAQVAGQAAVGSAVTAAEAGALADEGDRAGPTVRADAASYAGAGDTYPDASPPPIPEPGTLDGDKFGEARPGDLDAGLTASRRLAALS